MQQPSSAPPAPPAHHISWRAAPQPDIVRAAQKDDLYLQQSIDACHDAVMRAWGAIPALQHAKSCRLLATFMYYATTTAAGLQTLGEEYCDIMQLSHNNQQQQQQLAPARTRVLLTLLQSLGPALLSRLVASLDRAGDEGRLLLQYEQLGYDEGDEGYGFMADEQQQQQHEQAERCVSAAQPAGWQQLARQHARRGWQALQQRLGPHWPSIKAWLLFAGRVHLAAFYLRGHYYEWAKRLLGVRYTSISPNKEQRASYRFLGYMLVVQLAVAGLMQAREQLAAASAAASAQQEHGGSSSSGQLLGAAGSAHTYDQHARLLPDPVLQEGTHGGSSAAAAASAAVQAATGGPSSSSSGSKQCPLCLSVRSHPTCTPCGHVFCWQCIAQWCLEKPECPLCRTGVVSSQLVCLYHSDF